MLASLLANWPFGPKEGKKTFDPKIEDDEAVVTTILTKKLMYPRLQVTVKTSYDS